MELPPFKKPKKWEQPQEKRFPIIFCQHCAVTFSTQFQLEIHIIAEHFKEKLECKMCSRDFTFASTLKLHILNNHKDVNKMVVDTWLASINKLEPDFQKLKYINSQNHSSA